MIRSRVTRRSGFTLVELIVVIAVIVILMSLLTAGIMRAYSKMNEAQARSDISQLATSLQAFMGEYQVNHVPSRLALREDGRYGDNPNSTIAAIELETESYLKRLWPRLVTAGRTGNPPPNSRTPLPNTNFTDWNGDGAYNSGATYILEGDQSLVFLLGGIQRPDVTNTFKTPSGFSTNPQNPTLFTAGTKGPFYEFKRSRLAMVNHSQTGNSQFLSYNDPWGTPYLYFSSSRGGNDYWVGPNNNFSTSDCPSAPRYDDHPDLGGSVVGPVLPYPEAILNGGVRFHNPNSFQIISAGKDQVFGSCITSGGAWYWKPNAGYRQDHPGADDMSNFHGRLLGSTTE
jgi:prepilin-type N-terminal cleavage/methylation domain-containing protein